MSALAHELLAGLAKMVSSSQHRVTSLQEIANHIRTYGSYRWVGLYDVNHRSGVVTNLVWSGPSAPAYPTFPMTNGLTGAAVTERATVNVGDVSADGRYLTALGTTRSEIIIPVFDREGASVVGTIDVESEALDAFGKDVEDLLQSCAAMIRPLWIA
jgi:putative methionine-R-sulfoxide reductase with GAF domain